MRKDKFDIQISRLCDVYGDKQFPKERVILIWNEVQHFDDFWMERTASHFIADSRYAPLVKDFAQEATVERERLYRIEKDKNTKESEKAMRSIYALEDIGAICQGILKRINHQMPDDDFKSFTKMITVPAHPGESNCRGCGGSGILDAEQNDGGAMYVFRCSCEAGSNDTRNYPQWGPQHRERFTAIKRGSP